MNKPIVTFLLCIGLAGPAFAAKAVNASPSEKVARAETVMNQNSANSTVCPVGWMDRIAVGGMINVDAAWGDHQPIGNFTDTTYATDLYVNNANLFVDVKVNNWIKAHINLEYLGQPEYYGHDHFFMDPPPGPNNMKAGDGHDDEYHNWKAMSWKYRASKDISLDEAYIDIANFNSTPFYIRAGEQYVAFGDYDRYPLVTSLTQWLSETRQPALTVGVITDYGFYAQGYIFNGNYKEWRDEETYRLRNFGAKLGYYGNLSFLTLNDTHFNVDISWIKNMFDTDFFQGSANVYVTAAPLPPQVGDYEEPYYLQYHTLPVGNVPKAVNGFAAHFDISHGPFDFYANYVTAMSDMLRISTNGVINDDYPNAFVPEWEKIKNTKLWAADVNADYAFKTLDHESKVGISYQWSDDGDLSALPRLYHPGDYFTDTLPWVFSLPHSRFVVDYKVNIWKNTDLGFALVHNSSYAYRKEEHPIPSVGQARIHEDTVKRNSYEALVRLSVAL
jgi:hypothetical protein